MDPVNTPAYAPPSDPTAIMGRRIVAFILDVVIGIAVAVIVFAAVAESADMGSSTAAERTCDSINDTTNHVCINAGSTVILAEDDDLAVVALSWLVPALSSIGSSMWNLAGNPMLTARRGARTASASFRGS